MPPLLALPRRDMGPVARGRGIMGTAPVGKYTLLPRAQASASTAAAAGGRESRPASRWRGRKRVGSARWTQTRVTEGDSFSTDTPSSISSVSTLSMVKHCSWVRSTRERASGSGGGADSRAAAASATAGGNTSGQPWRRATVFSCTLHTPQATRAPWAAARVLDMAADWGGRAPVALSHPSTASPCAGVALTCASWGAAPPPGVLLVAASPEAHPGGGCPTSTSRPRAAASSWHTHSRHSRRDVHQPGT